MTPNKVPQRQFERLWRFLWLESASCSAAGESGPTFVSADFPSRPHASYSGNPCCRAGCPSCASIPPPQQGLVWEDCEADDRLVLLLGLFCFQTECLSAAASPPLRGGKQMQPIYLKPLRSCCCRPRGSPSFTGTAEGNK